MSPIQRTRSLIAPVFVVLALALTSSRAFAQDIDAELGKLSERLSTRIARSSAKKVSVVDFSDLQGATNELGRYIAEQLSVDLVNSSKGFAVMDRAHLKSVLDEHKFTASGLVNPATAKKVGQFAGVDAIVLGSIASFDDSLVITGRVIATETSELLAAEKVTVARSKAINALLAQEVAAAPTSQSTPQAAPTDSDFTSPAKAMSFDNVAFEIVSFKAEKLT